ncbi:MAG: hypothetical protein WC136_00435 [Sphaerochaeta sp.]|jgi:hypothetical protein
MIDEQKAELVYEIAFDEQAQKDLKSIIKNIKNGQPVPFNYKKHYEKLIQQLLQDNNLLYHKIYYDMYPTKQLVRIKIVFNEITDYEQLCKVFTLSDLEYKIIQGFKSTKPFITIWL